MLDLDLQVINLEQARRQINALESDLKKKANRAGLTEIAKPLKRDLMSILPAKTGVLKRSIGYKTLSKRRMGQMGLFDDDAMEVAATRKVLDKSGKKRHQTYKLRFISYGTDPHTIKARKGGFLKLHGGHYAKEVEHPGIQGQNYLKRTYDKHQSNMPALFVRGAYNMLLKHGHQLQLAA